MKTIQTKHHKTLYKQISLLLLHKSIVQYLMVCFYTVKTENRAANSQTVSVPESTLLLHHAFVSVSLTSCSWSRTLLKSRSQLAFARSAGSTASSRFATLGVQRREVLQLNNISHSHHGSLYYSTLALIIMSVSSYQYLLCLFYYIFSVSVWS